MKNRLPNYRAGQFRANGHWQTILPALLRRVRLPKPYQRQRLELPDGDFLDLDWLKQDQPSEALMVISHGLEGNSQSPYVRGMAAAGFKAGLDVVAWNFRGCSGTINRKLRMYHSGATDDLHSLLQALSPAYRQIYLVGFSLGGNLTLKYLGEQGVYAAATKAIAFSAPLQLMDAARTIDQGINRVYAKRFLKSLKNKIVQKKEQFPEKLDTTMLPLVNSLEEFDEYFTAPLHGFQGATDYYTRCSSIHFLPDIAIPTRIVNAQNDPMIGKASTHPTNLPFNRLVSFISTRQGGHCGYPDFGLETWWPEAYALKWFLQDR